jgi:hypothetical protein
MTPSASSCEIEYVTAVQEALQVALGHQLNRPDH